MLKNKYPDGRVRVFFSIIGNARGRKPKEVDALEWDALAKWDAHGATLLDPEQIALEGLWNVIGKDASMILAPGFVVHHINHHVYDSTKYIDEALANAGQ